MDFEFNTSKNLKHTLNYDTIGDYPCRKIGNSDYCDGVCRCYTISSVEINTSPCEAGSVLLSILVRDWKNIEDNNRLKFYCLERAFRKHFCGEMFEATWSSGYYGDEVDSITIDKSSSAWADFLRDVNQVFILGKPDLQEIVQRTLLIEYHILLKKIQEVDSWEIKSLHMKDVEADQRVLSQVDQQIAQGYLREPPLHEVQGVAIFDGKKYRIIDGFHRFAAWSGAIQDPQPWVKKPKHRKIKLLCGTKKPPIENP